MQTLKSIGRFFFGDSARAFGSASIILLVLLAVAPAKDYFSQWRYYQKQYLHLIRGRADAVTLERHFKPGIHQIWIPEQQVTDRCTTCHLGLKENSLAGITAVAFRRHPVIPHKLTEFGCTTCHRGQGAATTLREAHNSTEQWEQPLLLAKYIEAGCGQCHLGAQTATPFLNQGRKLIARYGCTHCHTIKQGDGTYIVPDDDPPSLKHIADKTTREWVYAWIKDPQSYASTATMPNFQFSDDDARDISAFVMAQSTPLEPPLQPLNTTIKAAADPAAGTTLYGESFCASCHAIQNAAGVLVGGDFGPELTGIGTKAKPEWLQDWVTNPNHYDPQTMMPHYRFTAEQVATLVGFLQSKTEPDFVANVHLGPATPQQIEHGKRLVMEDGCAACHEINGIKKPDNFAPELNRIGSKPLNQVLFVEGVKHTLPDYIGAKIRNPRAFGPSLKMPQFKFTPQQVDAITTALLALTDRAQTQPPTMRISAVQQSSYQPAGHAGQLMHDLRCFSCHCINGHGGDMAPDLSWEGTAVQRDWLVQFLKNPGTLRPALIRRMPKFNLSDAEVNTLADYIMTVYQTPEFDRDSMPASEFTPAQVEQGRQLFYSKFACQSCHIADYSKDKGYIGPALTATGKRFNAAWLYHWLKDPQALRPGTMEPNQNMTDDEARSLTAFLMSLTSGNSKEATSK
ncbi:MAG TPA: c-type cytochrome [Terriglobales bacterium]|nr:c-type cytochrome [Terriglobales bacterium]